MNVIYQSNERYINILKQEFGENKRDENKSQRLLKYLVIEDADNGKAVYNELTRSFIWIPYDQWENMYTEKSDYVDFLWKNYFLVNEDFDEYKAQEKLKICDRPSCENENYLKPGNIYEYTIFATMACNARCFYCYEKGRPQKPMTAATARKIGEYIVKTAMKNGRTIELRWFGGEPLVGENCIDIICQIVKDAGYNYNSSITTNGFLFKKEKLDKYRDLWHLTFAQITIDGTEEVYNKTKNYKNVKGKNPYQIVMDNIKMMAEWGLNISIRMNMDLYNAENIKELIKELHDRFKDNKNVTPYCWPIFEDDEHPRTDEHNEQLYEKLKEIEDVLKEYNYYHPKYRNNGVRATHCMIDHGGAVVFGTQGDIGLCEHYSDDNFWGHVDKPEMKDMDMIRSFQDYEEPIKGLCDDCSIMPSCIRAKKCHDLRACNRWIKEWHLREAHCSVKEMYKDWKRNIENQKNNSQCCNNQCCNNQGCNNQGCDNQECNCNKENIEETEKKGIFKFFENILILLGIK